LNIALLKIVVGYAGDFGFGRDTLSPPVPDKCGILYRLVAPRMRELGWGRIVNIASVHGLVGSINKSAYVASKHGLIGLTKSAALEYAGIRKSSVTVWALLAF